jgi:hypothetical protein
MVRIMYNVSDNQRKATCGQFFKFCPVFAEEEKLVGGLDILLKVFHVCFPVFFYFQYVKIA